MTQGHPFSGAVLFDHLRVVMVLHRQTDVFLTSVFSRLTENDRS